MAESNHDSVDDGRVVLLISTLVTDPDHFARQGWANELARAFRRGYPVQRLRELLRASDPRIVRSAVWIASELGDIGTALLDEAVTLLSNPDDYVRYYALDVLTLATDSARTDMFWLLVHALDDPDSAVRGKAVRLIYWANPGQIAAARHAVQAGMLDSVVHESALQALTEQPSETGALFAEQLLSGSHRLQKQYGVILAARWFSAFPYLLAMATESTDKEIADAAKFLMSLQGSS